MAVFVMNGKERWEVADDLKESARTLCIKYDDEVGYVDVDSVIFVRVYNKSAKWFGKTYHLKAPNTLLPAYSVSNLVKLGFISEQDIPKIPLWTVQPRYLIVLNSDCIESSQGDLGKIEEVTLLHELKHISPDGEGLVKHDSEDFKFILDTFGTHWDEGIFKEDEEASEIPMLAVVED